MAETYRVLVTGSRTWKDWQRVFGAIAAVAEQVGKDRLVVVHGAARDGADRFAHLAAKALGVREEPHPADWARYNRRAGMIRNGEMVKAGADMCLAYVVPCTLRSCAGREPHGSHGASDCAARAEKAGIDTRRFTDD